MGLYIGMAIALVAIVAVSILSGKAAKSKKGANTYLVAGAIMGTLVGGASTIGTAQLAYQFGMSAWWFTLGGGISCLILALFYAKPFRESGNKTLVAFIAEEYDRKTGILASLFSSLGSFISVISQLVAATAIIEVVLPGTDLVFSILISALFMVLYVIFGGTKGSGIVGIIKMLLLYLTVVAVGAFSLYLAGGISGFEKMVDGITNPEAINFRSLFARGVGEDLGACLSLLLGVITTQSYAQSIFMADKTKDAINGALLSAVLTPPVGISGILVGLYMRATHPGIAAKTALTSFITEYMPPLLGGLMLGTLFVTVVGAGAGLALGVVINIKNDLLSGSSGKYSFISSEKLLLIITLLLASVLSMGPFGDTILKFAFMSMGLRGATLFAPLCCAIWCRGRVERKYALAAVIAGPVTVLLLNLIGGFPFDPLFVGVFVALAIMIVGCFTKTNKRAKIK